MFPQRRKAGPATDACRPATPARGLFQDAGWRQVDIRKAQPCEELLSLSETLVGQVLSWSSGSWSEPLCVYTVGVLSMSHLMICRTGWLLRTLLWSGSLHCRQFQVHTTSSPCASAAKGRGRTWDPCVSHLAPPFHTRRSHGQGQEVGRPGGDPGSCCVFIF